MTKRKKSKKNLHMGLILDGNRRYAKKLGFKDKVWKGHEKGAEKVDKLMDWTKELGIKQLTLFAFSTENFNRRKKEVDYLMNLFSDWFDRIKSDERIDKNKVKINFIGRLNLFPKKIQKQMSELMKKTEKYNNYVVNFAMAYGGRAEIIDAVNKILKKTNKNYENTKKKIKKINERDFEKHLYLPDSPDIIIRTGGEKRLSGFLPWQSVYSELFFIDKLWPEIIKKDLKKCINEFYGRERRFGK